MYIILIINNKHTIVNNEYTKINQKVNFVIFIIENRYD